MYERYACGRLYGTGSNRGISFGEIILTLWKQCRYQGIGLFISVTLELLTTNVFLVCTSIKRFFHTSRKQCSHELLNKYVSVTMFTKTWESWSDLSFWSSDWRHVSWRHVESMAGPTRHLSTYHRETEPSASSVSNEPFQFAISNETVSGLNEMPHLLVVGWNKSAV